MFLVKQAKVAKNGCTPTLAPTHTQFDILRAACYEQEPGKGEYESAAQSTDGSSFSQGIFAAK